ncbi:hypothetical protein VTI74DRAFT_1118 [Chaetomium olivicolor]
MKATVIAALALAGAVTAQEFPSNMPQCGVICGHNVFNQHDQYGCGAGDVGCLCKNANFGYGIHDCSVQSCPSLEDANIVIGWGNNLCANANHPINIPSATALGSNIVPSTSVSEVITTIVSGSSTFVTTSTVSGSESSKSSESGAASPITTSTWTSVFTSGSVTTTLTGETTVSGISGVAGATSIPETTMTEPIVSTKTEGSTTFETTIGTTTFVSSVTGDALSSALSSQASHASHTSSGNDAQMTAAPVFGVIAAAGIAAALL